MMRKGGVLRCTGLVILLLLLLTTHAKAFTTCKSLTPRQAQSTLKLKAKLRRGYVDEDDGSARERSVERPTLTETQVSGTPVQPSKPKIVVLGASGRIGSLVVRQLLGMTHLDATIVAFVRDYDKACRVLYDDVLVARAPKRKGPQLEIVVGDLVPPEELPGLEDEDEQVWLQTAQSAANFFGTTVEQYDKREAIPDVNEALQEAIRGCTTIISCVGSVRPTNWWTDFIVMPFWRLFRRDVSGWCHDSRHPYYVHYASTRKVLGYAEREQLRREAMAMALAKEEDGVQPQEIPRIRFVRVSDLCVTQKPWELVPLVTNTVHSMVFRYQDMAERLLEESKVIDTVILRPGDLVDDERDVNTTSLQVDSSGKVPYPARVGRDDVAELAIAASMFQAANVTVMKSEMLPSQVPPLHLTLGVRWAGEELDPYPSQGSKRDGLANAHQCMKKVLKEHLMNVKRKRRRSLRSTANIPESILRYATFRRRSLKPYGVCVAVPVYFFLGLIVRNMFCYVLGYERVALAIARVRNTVAGALLARLPSIRPWMSRMLQKSRKSYISF